MKNIVLLTLMIVIVVQAGCASNSISSKDLSTAQDTLVSFFSLLAFHAYPQAAELYGGDYETLSNLNPDLAKDDLGLLWQRACESNGYQCLEIDKILSANRVGVDEYHFLVQFRNKDGSIFVLRPCCGSDATQQSPQSEFKFIVKRTKGRFTVLDLPVYMP